MEQNKLTIIIPTRERGDTLYWAIKTCINQNYDNLEIIVCDNFSSDNTREIVADFQADKRVKYINTGKRISMSHNWEFALNHVNEGFVSVLGDDDGFLPNTMLQINSIISAHNASAIGWLCPHYRWPDFDYGRSNMLSIHTEDFTIKLLNAKDELRGILDLNNPNKGCGILPSLYRNFVDIKYIKKVKELTKNFFLSQIPDYYSGIALSAVIDDFVYTSIPFSISGGSGRSNGASQFNQHVNPKESNLFDNEGNIPYHKNFTKSYTSSVFSAECYLQAQDAGLFSKEFFDIDYIQIIRASLQEAKTNHPSRYKYLVDCLIELAKINDIPKENVLREIAKYPNKPLNDTHDYIVEGYNHLTKRIDVDASKYGAKNVYDAVLLYEKIYNNRHEFMKLQNSIIPTISIIKRELMKRYL